ncbi:MAG: monofunctional biosynthetic peptidoglycan transglycosylase [Bacteroidota bacterium]|jgi:monofunctional biosynthetic peptidoglycan transglycosylase
MGYISRRLADSPRALKVYQYTKKIFIYMFIAQFVYIILGRWIPIWTTPTIIWEATAGGKTIKKQWISIDKVSDSMKEAVLAKEDQVFMEHHGFDFEAIEKAMEYNKRHKKRKQGASTISQQVAKNVFLWQGRTWLRKGLEVYFTLMIELFWSKERILEVYLNVAEMGSGVFGAEAAAQTFFKKSAAKLNRSESALIAASLSNPKIFKVDNPSPQMLKKQRWIIREMENVEWED